MTRLLALPVLAFILSGCSVVGVDKMYHATAGLGIGMIGDEVLDGHGCELAIAAGITKELIDPVFSLPDVIATSMYCIVPLLKGKGENGKPS